MKKTRKNTRPSTKMNQVLYLYTQYNTHFCIANPYSNICTHSLHLSSSSSLLYALPLFFLFPVTACHSKAVFLLKFAGLSRVKEENLERPGSPVVQRPSWNQQSKRWRKISAVVGTVGRFKHQVCVCVRAIHVSLSCSLFSCFLCFLSMSVSISLQLLIMLFLYNI